MSSPSMPTANRGELIGLMVAEGHAITCEPSAAAPEFAINSLPREDLPAVLGWYLIRCSECGARGVSGPGYFYGEQPLFVICVSSR